MLHVITSFINFTGSKVWPRVFVLLFCKITGNDEITGGTMERPQKHVEEDFVMWRHLHFSLKCPKIEHIHFCFSSKINHVIFSVETPVPTSFSHLFIIFSCEILTQNLLNDIFLHVANIPIGSHNTPECVVGDWYLMLVPNSRCCWRDLSLTSKSCHQHIWSLTSMLLRKYSRNRILAIILN